MTLERPICCSRAWMLWLSFQYLPDDLLERRLWGSLTVVRRSSPQSPGQRVFMIFLFRCIVSLFYDVVFLFRPYISYYTAQYSLFVLTLPLNINQLTNELQVAHTSTQPTVGYRRPCRNLSSYWPTSRIDIHDVVELKHQLIQVWCNPDETLSTGCTGVGELKRGLATLSKNVDSGAFSGQRLRWKTPRGLSALLLCV